MQLGPKCCKNVKGCVLSRLFAFSPVGVSKGTQAGYTSRTPEVEPPFHCDSEGDMAPRILGRNRQPW